MFTCCLWPQQNHQVRTAVLNHLLKINCWFMVLNDFAALSSTFPLPWPKNMTEHFWIDLSGNVSLNQNFWLCSTSKFWVISSPACTLGSFYGLYSVSWLYVPDIGRENALNLSVIRRNLLIAASHTPLLINLISTLSVCLSFMFKAPFICGLYAEHLTVTKYSFHL